MRAGVLDWASENGAVWVRGDTNPAVSPYGIVYFEKIRVFKAGTISLKPLNISAWDNGIGLVSYFVGFQEMGND